MKDFIHFIKYTTIFSYNEDNFFMFPKEQNSTIIFLWLIQTKPFTF